MKKTVVYLLILSLLCPLGSSIAAENDTKTTAVKTGKELHDEAFANLLTLAQAWYYAESDQQKAQLIAEVEAIKEDPNSYLSEGYDRITITKINARDQIAAALISAMEAGKLDRSTLSGILATHGIDMQYTKLQEGYAVTGIFGKSHITVTLKNTAAMGNEKAASVMRSTQYFYKAYFLVGDYADFTADLEKRIAKICEATGMPKEMIGYGVISSKEHFRAVIENVVRPEEKEGIAFFLVWTHCNANAMYWGAGAESKAEEIAQLPLKTPIWTMVLLGCNTSTGKREGNVACAFAKNPSIGAVVAARGETFLASNSLTTYEAQICWQLYSFVDGALTIAELESNSNGFQAPDLIECGQEKGREKYLEMLSDSK